MEEEQVCHRHLPKGYFISTSIGTREIHNFQSRLKPSEEVLKRRAATAERIAKLKASAARYAFLKDNEEATGEYKDGKFIVQPRNKGKFAGKKLTFE